MSAVSESCSCGATIEIEMLYTSDVRSALEGFRKAHAECRRQTVASPPNPWYPFITWDSGTGTLEGPVQTITLNNLTDVVSTGV